MREGTVRIVPRCSRSAGHSTQHSSVVRVVGKITHGDSQTVCFDTQVMTARFTWNTGRSQKRLPSND